MRVLLLLSLTSMASAQEPSVRNKLLPRKDLPSASGAQLAEPSGTNESAVGNFLRERLRKEPSSPEVLYLYAAHLAEVKDIAGAEFYLQKLFALQPMHPRGLELKNRLALEERTAAKDRSRLERAILLKPDSYEAHFDYALYLYSRDSLAEAKKAVLRSIGLNRSYSLARELSTEIDSAKNIKERYEREWFISKSWHKLEGKREAEVEMEVRAIKETNFSEQLS